MITENPSGYILIIACVLAVIVSIIVAVQVVRKTSSLSEEKHFYVQEHEVFGDSSRIVWTSKNITEIQAKEMWKNLTATKEEGTWFNIVRDYD